MIECHWDGAEIEVCNINDNCVNFLWTIFKTPTDIFPTPLTSQFEYI